MTAPPDAYLYEVTAIVRGASELRVVVPAIDAIDPRDAERVAHRVLREVAGLYTQSPERLHVSVTGARPIHDLPIKG